LDLNVSHTGKRNRCCLYFNKGAHATFSFFLNSSKS
jgi:hypothetical protein